MLQTVTKEITFSASHRLLEYDGACSNLHGHNYRLLMTLHGSELIEGMVCDFSLLKNCMVGRVFDDYDHACIVNKEDTVMLDFLRANKMKHVILPGNPTAEVMARDIFQRMEFFGAKDLTITLYETDTSYTVYKGE